MAVDGQLLPWRSVRLRSSGRVFFFSYLQGDLNDLTWLGQIFLITVFILCLATTLLPIRYFRQDLIY